MGLKLYGTPSSPITGRVLLSLHEKELNFEYVPVDLLACEHKQPNFLAKHPFGQTPALEDGDLTLFGKLVKIILLLFLHKTVIQEILDCSIDACLPIESRAITAYLAEKYKNTGYHLTRHQNPKEAALVKVWTEVESQSFNPAIHPIYYQYFVAPLYGKSPDRTVMDAYLEKLEKVLDVYEAKLSETKYLAGDFYSLADLHNITYIHYLMKTPYDGVITERPHVNAWWDDISSRPASMKVAEDLTLGD
ncbi:glutathione S-transferase family protein [Tripterygium wilfordii]|uniref:glutathione transferase n=1 Tax=Tripterygium wilfordii TaxID=458696 RepID=A0A7J7CFY8_TRIWF|nr:glutathione S-transferase family protein [Tripterygium wilfordii]